jgi:hypothetical protein
VVVGHQRSGTSAVYAALCAHPRLVQSPEADKEPWFLQEFFLGRRHHVNRRRHAGSALDRAFTQEYAELVDRFCRQRLARGSERWICAHPDDRFFLAEVFELFPAARVLYLLRHPQEVVWSILHSPWAQSDGRHRFLELARHEAEQWLRSAAIVQHTLAGQFAGRVLVVRQEQLRLDPEAAARLILDHVGEPYDPAVARKLGQVWNSSFLPDGSAAHGLHGRLAESSRDTAFCRIIAETCGDAMRRLGYEPTGPTPTRLSAYLGRHPHRVRWLARLLGI